MPTKGKCADIDCNKTPLYNLKGLKPKFCVKHKESTMIDVKHPRCVEPDCILRASFNLQGEKKPLYCSTHKKENMIDICNAMCLEPTCNTRPVYNFSSEKRPIYCFKHKKEGMIDVKSIKCAAGCGKLATYNQIGSRKPKYCKDHKLVHMIDVKHPKCLDETCDIRPNFNYKTQKKPIYCSFHKKEGMIDIITPRCIYPEGCDTQPTFNYEGQKTALYCVRHKLEQMVDVVSKRCAAPDCNKIPNYNIPGSSSAKFCKDHKTDIMIDITHKRCEKTGCKTRPHYNIRTEKIGRFCSRHKEQGMIDVVNPTCLDPTCDTQPSFNLPGNKKGIYCALHKLEGMVDLVTKKCENPICNKGATYGIKGEQKAKFCLEHKSSEMVDVKHSICQEQTCTTRTRYGRPGFKPTHCGKHRKTGILVNPTTKCLDCKEQAIYGINFILQHCETHNRPEEQNLAERECVSCHLLYVLDANNHCENCDPTAFKRIALAKQTDLMDYLDAHGHPGTATDDTMIDGGACGKERPDRIIDLGDKILIIECDENQHSDRSANCEKAHMFNIGQSLGGMPVYFIRWNPDKFRTPKHKQESIKERYEILCEFLTNIKSGQHQLPTHCQSGTTTTEMAQDTNTCLVWSIYMFYNCWNGKTNGLATDKWQPILSATNS